MINKKTNEFTFEQQSYIKKHNLEQYKREKLVQKSFLVYLFCICIFAFVMFTLINKSEQQAKIYITKPSVQAIQDAVIDCINLGSCEEVPTTKDYTHYKGVKTDKAILEALEKNFTLEQVNILKVILLAECAKDYDIDGVASYECRHDTVNYNTNDTYDCGWLQINQKEKCTKESFRLDYQITSAYNKVYSLNNEYCGGLNCWSSYKFKNSPTIKTSYHKWNSK